MRAAMPTQLVVVAGATGGLACAQQGWRRGAWASGQKNNPFAGDGAEWRAVATPCPGHARSPIADIPLAPGPPASPLARPPARQASRAPALARLRPCAPPAAPSMLPRVAGAALAALGRAPPGLGARGFAAAAAAAAAATGPHFCIVGSGPAGFYTADKARCVEAVGRRGRCHC